MNKLLVSLPALFFFAVVNGQPFQLAPPLLKYKSIFFKDSAIVEMEFAEKNTSIHYHLANSRPTEKDDIYAKSIVIKDRISHVSAITSGKGFLSSDPVYLTFIKDGITFNVTHQTEPDGKFTGNGITTLNDNRGGNTDLNSGTWLGYKNDSVVIELKLNKPLKLSGILIHVLRDNANWIYLPEQTNVFYQKNKYLVPVFSYPDTSTFSRHDKECISKGGLFTKEIVSDNLIIVIKPLQSIPQDHPGKGQKAWLFIDEIKLY